MVIEYMDMRLRRIQQYGIASTGAKSSNHWWSYTKYKNQGIERHLSYVEDIGVRLSRIHKILFKTHMNWK